MSAADERGLLALSSVLTPPALVGFQFGLRCDVQVRMQSIDSGAGDWDGLANTALCPISQWREREHKSCAGHPMSLQRDRMILLAFLVAFLLLRHLGVEDAGWNSRLIGSAFYSIC